MPHLKKTRRLTDELDKIFAERKGTNVMPRKFELIRDNHVIWERKFNVLPTVGLADYAKNRTGESNNQTTHQAIGTGITDPAPADVQLENEVARKLIGQRTVVGTTERHSSIFYRSDVQQDYSITESGLFTAPNQADLNNVIISHVTFSPRALDSEDSFITLQVNIVGEDGGAS